MRLVRIWEDVCVVTQLHLLTANDLSELEYEATTMSTRSAAGFSPGFSSRVALLIFIIFNDIHNLMIFMSAFCVNVLALV